MRVLLVEDDAAYAAMIARGARHAGIDRVQVCTARLAARSAELAQRGFDAVLLDLGLPDSRASRPSSACTMRRRDVPIVVLTSRR